MSPGFRRGVNLGMTALCGVAVLAAMVPLVSVLWLVVSHGAPGLLAGFAGTAGPIARALGRGLAAAGLGLALARALGAFPFLQPELVWVGKVPSILAGLLGYCLLVVPLGSFSRAAGWVALAVMLAPGLARSAAQVRSHPGWRSWRWALPAARGAGVALAISALAAHPFFSALPAPVGEVGGGLGNAIVGTLYTVGLGCLIGLPIGIGAGVYLAERGDGRLGDGIRFTAEVLSGVPSIVVGIVAYGLLVIPMKRFSALAGGVALAILMLPGLCRTTEEMVRLVPTPLREGGLALGVPAWKTTLRVILPTARSGILTAVLLGVARSAGETAPLLFTSLNNQYWNLRPDQPTASLTVQIFNYAISPYDDWHQKAWSAALVLLMLVGTASLTARRLRRA